MAFCSKIFSLLELILQNYFVSFNPAKVIYHKARAILIKDNSIKYLIITGSFYLFFLRLFTKKRISSHQLDCRLQR